MARLRQACATKPPLLGILVQGGELAGGVLRLTGTLDRREQAAALEAEANEVIGGEASWKAQIPGNASAAAMAILPVRSELLPKLRRDFAASPADPTGRPGLLQQTRLDDVAFDPAGRLKVSGLCVNQRAFLDRQKDVTDPAQDPRAQIAQGVRERLRSYPMPAGVAPGILDRVEASAIEIKEDPARRLQALAATAAGTDEVVFLETRFDGEGRLRFDGLVGSEEERAVAAKLIGRPEISAEYLRPGGAPAADPATAFSSMVLSPWRQKLLAGIQERFARPNNKGTELDQLRYCRIDRARFGYRDEGGLQLRFSGLALTGDDPSATVQIVAALHDETVRLLQPPRPIEYSVFNDVKPVSNPRRVLQTRVAAEPSVDGVRIDDVTIGSKGETMLEGVWIGDRQAAPLDSLVKPVLASAAGGGIVGPLAHRFTTVPTDQILRDLRTKTAASFDETTLDRLCFQPSGGTSPPVPTLMGSTPQARVKSVSAALAVWLKADRRTGPLGAEVVKLSITGRPGSLLNELRTMVARDTALDGVRIDRAVFDASNVLTLSGYQGRDGQAAQALALVPAALARVWPDAPPLAPARAGVFTTVPLQPKLDRLRRVLPNYREADGVLLSRAYYQPDGALTFAGRDSGSAGARPGVERLIKSLAGVHPAQVVKLALQAQVRDPERASRLVARNIEMLARNAITQVPLEELDEIIFLEPDDSTAWYLRAAYYYALGDRELTDRDLGRVKWLDTNSPSQAADRGRRLTRFQGPSRVALDEMLALRPSKR